MPNKIITEEIREALRAPLPPEAVSPHPSKKYLSTIKAIYVVERLNDVFGIGNWFIKNKILKESNGMVIAKSRLTIPEYGIEIEHYGGNDNADLGDAYKGACTDALTKMASFLEIGIDVFKGESNPKPKKVLKKSTTTSGKVLHATLNPKDKEFKMKLEILKARLNGRWNPESKKWTIIDNPENRETLIEMGVEIFDNNGERVFLRPEPVDLQNDLPF